MMSLLLLSLALEGGPVGVVTGPDGGRPPVAQVAPMPDPAAGAAPSPGPGGVTPPDQARQEAQAARAVQRQLPGARVLQVETRDGARRVRVLHNGQVRDVVVPQ